MSRSGEAGKVWRTLLIWIAAVVVAGIAAYAYVMRTRLVATPLCVAEAVPEKARFVAGNWVWLERSGKSAAVVSVRGGRRSLIARHDRIADLWPSASLVAWIAGDGETWTIRTAKPDGSEVRVIAECAGKPLAVWTDGRQMAWLVDVPAKVATAASFIPSLGRTTELWRSRQGETVRAGVLAEGLASAQILGVREGAYLVSCVRDEGIRCSVLYAIGPHVPPIRFAGEVGWVSALLSSDGLIYWTAPSRGSNSLLTGCIRSADTSSLTPATVADWLPAGGRLVETKRGIVVVGVGSETAWRIDAAKRIGVPVPMLPAEWPVGGGDDVLLTVRRAKTPGRVVVNTVRLP